MIDERYLWHGINALSRAHEVDYFGDGHRGGAIVSGYYLCRENRIEEGVSGMIADRIDQQWARTELCAPFPPEDADFGLLERIVEATRANMEGLREAGHNVILPTLALKAFHDLPAAVTPARVSGVCRLIESFAVSDVPLSDDDSFPNMDDESKGAEFILDEFLKCIERFMGRGQGWSGHLLTYGRALLELREMGYTDLSKMAEKGFKLYIRRIRFGPVETDLPRPEHSPTGLFPLQEAYWAKGGGDWAFGHALKYPYAFYGLMKMAKNRDLKQRCLAAAYHIF